MALIVNRSVVDSQSRPEPQLRLTGDDGLAAVPADLDAVAGIALHFDGYRDGRIHSMARLLRERFGYTGELRATGDILPDQVRELERCGFDSIELDDALIPAALECAGIVSVHMQPALDRT